jgi:hypothetical protein
MRSATTREWGSWALLSNSCCWTASSRRSRPRHDQELNSRWRAAWRRSWASLRTVATPEIGTSTGTCTEGMIKEVMSGVALVAHSFIDEPPISRRVR